MNVMMESYLYGFQYWNGDSSEDSFNETIMRNNIYERLKGRENGPYQYDFKEELQQSWRVEEN